MTVEEFLAWLETRPETERWELIGGEPVRLMAPTTFAHALIKDNVVAALRSALAARGAGPPCRVVSDGPAVRRADDGRSFYQPDAVVTCARSIDPTAITVPDPVVIMEVLSPSTRTRDFTAKMQGYFALPSVAHYLLVEQRKRLVVLMFRNAAGRIETAFRAEGRIDLDPPGVGLDIGDVYTGVELD
jgi:Uma2 family endonuclease